MKIVTTIQEAKEQIKEWKDQGLSVGLVPSMGYLHEGHASLMKAAVSQMDKVAVSVFVNPTQFGPNEDYDSYPRDLDHDIAICEEQGVDLIFHPSVEEMYGKNYNTYVTMETLGDELCGKSRPIHFRGVCTVVTKLFNILTPDKAFFGQKDAQQLAIIKRMVKDLNMNLEVVGCPIIREEDGLAKSSRNTYLSPEERQAALILSKTIFMGQKMVEEGERDVKTLLDAMKSNIETEPLARIDYVEVVDGETMQKVDRIEESVLVAMAVYIGNTRLIDNFMYEC
ncbi:MAG: pantoate--beta-alanine ligase [Lachnospiraceae bacterium]|nr:pantoate--beta-alanine ligase [Lachnospiraceae bacterium]